MDKYLQPWARQMIPDTERFTRHQPPHGSQRGFSPVELQADAPATDLEGDIITDVIIGGVPAYPIDRTPSRGGKTRRWTRGMSGAGEGGITLTGYNRENQATPLGNDACAEVSIAQGLARGRDYGAGILSTRGFLPHGPHGLMHGEHRSTQLTTGFSTTPMANQGGSGYAQYRRGLNADPLNDGAATGGTGTPPRPTAWRVGEEDGSLWRPARYLSTTIDRSFKPTRQLPTDQVQINPARTPTMIVTTTVPSRSSKGGVLFGSLAKFNRKSVPVGPLARTPGPWYEPAQAAADVADVNSLPDYSGAVYA